MLRYLSIAIAAVGLSACAFGDETLNVAYDVSSAKVGVLSEAAPATIHVEDVADKRVEKMRVGYKRNGFGQKTADILLSKPAPEVVKEALETVLQKNGHILGDDSSPLALKTDLTNFWFDAKTGLVTVEFYGEVQAEVSLVDTASGATLYSEVFDGYYSEKTGGGLRKTWERIMNAALDDFAAKVNLSSGLKDAIAAAEASAADDEGAMPSS
ncbi:MAG: hypothetical protein R3C60_09710 [Parvularculaceae bacterium]